MANSSKIKFSLATLKQRSLAAIDEKIAELDTAIAALEDETKFAQEVKTWRERQVAALANVITSLDQISNEDLAAFKVEPLPKRDVFEVQRASRIRAGLLDQRVSIVAKSDSLVPDEEGQIALTKTQLREFFNLD